MTSFARCSLKDVFHWVKILREISNTCKSKLSFTFDDRSFYLAKWAKIDKVGKKRQNSAKMNKRRKWPFSINKIDCIPLYFSKTIIVWKISRNFFVDSTWMFEIVSKVRPILIFSSSKKLWAYNITMISYVRKNKKSWEFSWVLSLLCICIFEKRATADELLEHPFIQSPDQAKCDDGYGMRLAVYNKKRMLRSGIRRVMAINKFLQILQDLGIDVKQDSKIMVA